MKSGAGDVKAVYAAKCGKCHGASGEGNVKLKTEPLDPKKSGDWEKAIAEGVEKEKKPKMKAMEQYDASITAAEMAAYLKTIVKAK